MARVDPMKSLGIVRSECDAMTFQAHLDGFVGMFVSTELQGRVHALMKRGPWYRVSQKIEKNLNPKRCRHWEEHSRPDAWPLQFAKNGVYIADLRIGLSMSVADASALSSKTCNDGIFSIVPGRLAVFLNHDWGVWFCNAPDSPILPPADHQKR